VIPHHCETHERHGKGETQHTKIGGVAALDDGGATE
jgi:hypothetical protein